MQFRKPGNYREYTSRPDKPGKDQQAWDYFTERHNAQPVLMFYRRTEGYPGGYSAEMPVFERVIQTFRLLRKEVPPDQSQPKTSAARRTKVWIYDDVPADKRLERIWNRAARDHGNPAFLRLEHPVCGPAEVTVTLDTRQEIRFDLEKGAET